MVALNHASGPRMRRRRAARLSGVPTATLRDVAIAAGVSTASASRALSSPASVSEDMHRRVVDAVRRVGYVANQAARTLATRRTGLVGVIMAVRASAVTMDALAAMQRALADAGYGLLCALAQSPGNASVQIAQLRARGVDGIVLAGLGEWAPARSEEEWALASTWLDPQVGYGSSTGGNRMQAYILALRFLGELGHRNIGSISEAAAPPIGAELANLTVELEVIPGRDDLSAIKQATVALLRRRPRVTAIVCASDLMALAVVCEARKQGIEVPHDLSVIGFGDSALGAVSSPALTSIRAPADAVGRETAAALLALLQKRPPSPNAAPSAKVVVRESTGPAP